MDIIDTRIFQVLDTYFEKHGYTYVAKQIDILPNNIHRIKASKAKFTVHQVNYPPTAKLTNGFYAPFYKRHLTLWLHLVCSFQRHIISQFQVFF